MIFILGGLALLTVGLQSSYTLNLNGTLSYIDHDNLTVLSECCFEQIENIPPHLLPTPSTLCLEPTFLQSISLLGFARNDSLPFWDFDLSADQGILKRPEPYNLTHRYPRITQQYISHTYMHLSTLDSSFAFSCGEFPPTTLTNNNDVFCTTNHNNNDNNNNTSRIPLVMQTRVPIADTWIEMLHGEALVIVSPPASLPLLKSFPIVHALRFQSQVNFSSFANAKLPSYFIPLHAGEGVHLPSFYSYRLVLLGPNGNQWTVERTLNNSMQHLRVQCIEAFPRFFLPNALSNQPVFFGLWALAVWSDVLFGFELPQNRSQEGALLSLVKNRWGRFYFRVGHADDENDLGFHAKEIIQLIDEECAEMKQIAKDLMLQDRDEFKTEVTTSASQIRKLMANLLPPINVEIGLDLMELAIANVFGAMGIRPFFKCYFSPIVL